jgi:hypothetical protein
MFWLWLDSVDRLHHVHPPHQHGARRQAAVPRLVGSHCRQSNLRRTVGVARLVSRKMIGGDVLEWNCQGQTMGGPAAGT